MSSSGITTSLQAETQNKFCQALSALSTKMPYFFGYMTVFFFQNNLKDLDPSYKTDLDLWNCS